MDFQGINILGATSLFVLIPYFVFMVMFGVWITYKMISILLDWFENGMTNEED